MIWKNVIRILGSVEENKKKEKCPYRIINDTAGRSSQFTLATYSKNKNGQCTIMACIEIWKSIKNIKRKKHVKIQTFSYLVQLNAMKRKEEQNVKRKNKSDKLKEEWMKYLRRTLQREYWNNETGVGMSSTINSKIMSTQPLKKVV